MPGRWNWAELSGASYTPGRGEREATLSIGVFDRLDAGVALIRQVLHRHRAGPGTRLTGSAGVYLPSTSPTNSRTAAARDSGASSAT
ncbi:hypothetical protein OHA72_52565 [Dactylosporangium sp. NBC_01737]|uniref:hypothetical protein n=1 Tax=Dactylosporangium sp. NBC_01737 TaxID=2975959 RepID=UPI002E14D057|nr:hypothetical protein OHA72_52565 [Dactylosporangium sp. NBC_01737]